MMIERQYAPMVMMVRSPGHGDTERSVTMRTQKG